MNQRLYFIMAMLFAALATPTSAQKENSTPAPMMPIELTLLDEDAIGYATFQSHNQKVVSNKEGIFVTHVRASNKDCTLQQ